MVRLMTVGKEMFYVLDFNNCSRFISLGIVCPGTTVSQCDKMSSSLCSVCTKEEENVCHVCLYCDEWYELKSSFYEMFITTPK